MWKKIKRPIHKFPPILFPLWLIAFLIDCIIRLSLWLVGFWKCDMCKRRYSMYDMRFRDVIPTQKVIKGKMYTKYKKVHTCSLCREQMQFEKQQKNNEYY